MPKLLDPSDRFWNSFPEIQRNAKQKSSTMVHEVRGLPANRLLATKLRKRRSRNECFEKRALNGLGFGASGRSRKSKQRVHVAGCCGVPFRW